MILRQNSSAAHRHQRSRPDGVEHFGNLVTPLVAVAGIPGAGKTEALKDLRTKARWARVVDPEFVRDHLSQWLPWLPYTYGRPIVHTIAHLWTLSRILHRGGGPLVIHDPGTRRWSRRLILNLALWLGYQPMIVYIDTDRETALKGQEQRKRVVRNKAFRRHWQRWVELRKRILVDEKIDDGARWFRVILSRRGTVVDDVVGLLKLEQDAESRGMASRQTLACTIGQSKKFSTYVDK